MAAYRLYFLGFKDAIQARQDFTAENDTEAKMIGGLLWRACADCYRGYELWQITRRLARESDGDTLVPPPAVEHLAPPLQERLLELQEALLGSHWRAAQSGVLLAATKALRRSLNGGTATLAYRDLTRYIYATTGTRMMSLQIAEGNQLRLRGSRGFDRFFDEYFAVVENGTCACGAAFKNRRQMVVPAIDSSPVFVGQKSLDVLRAQGVTSCISTPLLGGDGSIAGMFSIHRDAVWNPADGELAQLRHIAQEIVAAMANPLCAAAKHMHPAV
jgi:hypothetical protein